MCYQEDRQFKFISRGSDNFSRIFPAILLSYSGVGILCEVYEHFIFYFYDRKCRKLNLKQKLNWKVSVQQPKAHFIENVQFWTLIET